MLKKSTSKIWSCDFDLKEIRETMAELEHLRQRMDQMMNNLSQSSMKVENLREDFPPVNLTCPKERADCRALAPEASIKECCSSCSIRNLKKHNR